MPVPVLVSSVAPPGPSAIGALMVAVTAGSTRMMVSGAAASAKPPPSIDIAVGAELHAFEGDRRAQGDRAGGALEHREPALPGRVEAAVEGGPVGRGIVPGRAAAVDRAVAERVRAIPELQAEAAGC